MISTTMVLPVLLPKRRIHMEAVNLETTEYNLECKENQFLGLPLRQALKNVL